MTTKTVTFNGYAACHTDDAEGMAKTLREQFPSDVVEVVPLNKNLPPLEFNGVRQDKVRRDASWIDGLNFVD